MGTWVLINGTWYKRRQRRFVECMSLGLIRGFWTRPIATPVFRIVFQMLAVSPQTFKKFLAFDPCSISQARGRPRPPLREAPRAPYPRGTLPTAPPSRGVPGDQPFVLPRTPATVATVGHREQSATRACHDGALCLGRAIRAQQGFRPGPGRFSGRGWGLVRTGIFLEPELRACATGSQ